jgi:glutamate/tyrosine decarboxylase-like PLP-dependent enzyme
MNLCTTTHSTSRSFEALKIWTMLKHHGLEKFGRLINQNIDQARHLAELY